MPSRSRFNLARVDDDEVAEQVLAHPDYESSKTPSLEDFTPEVGAMTAVYDRLGELIETLIATTPGGKPQKVHPAPRPQTAFDRAQYRMSAQEHRELVDEVEAARQRRAEVEAAQERWQAGRG